VTRRPGSRLAVAACCVTAVAACGGSADTELGTRGEIAPPGERAAAPALSGRLLDGGTFDLAATRGKVVVLNVFGSWCTPCADEAPALEATYQATQGRGVEFVGLVERDAPDKTRAFVKTYGLTYPAVMDDDGGLVARFRALPVSAVPSTVVLDRSGRVAARWVGPVLGSQLRPVVERVAAEPGAASS
jgi:peroxiredoxin